MSLGTEIWILKNVLNSFLWSRTLNRTNISGHNGPHARTTPQPQHRLCQSTVFMDLHSQNKSNSTATFTPLHVLQVSQSCVLDQLGPGRNHTATFSTGTGRVAPPVVTSALLDALHAEVVSTGNSHRIPENIAADWTQTWFIFTGI